MHKTGGGLYRAKHCAKHNKAPDPCHHPGADLTPGLISVNSSTGSDCNADGGFGVFTMNPAGAAADYQFVVAVMTDPAAFSVGDGGGTV